MFPVLKTGLFNLGFEKDLFDKLLTHSTLPRLTSKKVEKGYILELDIPGVKKEDVEIKVEKGVLTISGERKEEKKDDKENYIVREVTYGSFKRSFVLPEEIDENKIEAKFEDGVLKISIEEKEKIENDIKKIEIK